MSHTLQHDHPQHDGQTPPESSIELLFKHVGELISKPVREVTARDFIELDDNPELKNRLAQLLAANQQYQESRDAELSEWRAQFLRVAEGWETAKDDLETIGFPRPDSIEGLRHLALIIEKDPEHESARTLYEHAIAWAERERLKVRIGVIARDELKGHVAQSAASVLSSTDATMPMDHSYSGIRLIRKHSSGLYGEVWEARQEKLNRKVAVKIISPEMVHVADALSHARALARVDAHENVVTVYDVCKVKCPGRDELVDGLVMEWLDGITLADRLLGQRLSIAECRPIIFGLLSGLQYMHSKDLVHGDLHAGNLVIMESVAKIIDVDVSKTYSLRRQSTASRDFLVRADVTSVQYLIWSVLKVSEFAYDRLIDIEAQLRSTETLSGIVKLMHALFHGIEVGPSVTSRTPAQDSTLAQAEWIPTLDRILVPLLITLEAFPQLQLDPGPGHLRSTFELTAERLRDLAIESFSESDPQVGVLTTLAMKCDMVADELTSVTNSTWDHIAPEVSKTQVLAGELRASLGTATQTSPDECHDPLRVLRDSLRRMRSLVDRMGQLIENYRQGDLLSEASRIGERLLTLTYYNLPFLPDDGRDQLHIAALDLYSLGFQGQFYGTFGSQERLSNRVRKQVGSIETLISKAELEI